MNTATRRVGAPRERFNFAQQLLDTKTAIGKIQRFKLREAESARG